MVSQSKELFINMKKKDIPEWIYGLPSSEQSSEAQDFWKNELKKCINGVTIDGYHLHPMLYTHVNFVKIPVDIDENTRYAANVKLRDNEYFFIENFKRAQDLGKNMLMFGTRQFGKALKDDEVVQTIKGPKRIGNILNGDRIYTADGTLTTVMNVYPQGIIRTYKVIFEDGREIVCCGEHLWQVFYNNDWRVLSLDQIIKTGELNKVKIPLNQAVQYPTNNNLRFTPDQLGVMIASILIYPQAGDIDLPTDLLQQYIISSAYQKEDLLFSFIKYIKSVVTGYDEIRILKPNMDLINFIKKIAWSNGWYCKFKDNILTLSSNRDFVKIESISCNGFHSCTCIEVDHWSKLFLTSNYIVTHNTAILSGLLTWRIITTLGNSHSIQGFSTEDLGHIINYLESSLDNLPEFFRTPRMGQWYKEVIIGSKDVGNVKDILARVKFINLAAGNKRGNVSTAGGSLSTAIWDEIGKGPIIKPYRNALPSYKSEYGARCTAVLCGTGGEEALHGDAQRMLLNPDAYELITMDWNMLDKYSTDRTWHSGRKCSIFVPAHMSLHEFNKKEKKTLSEYIGVKGKGLEKINIFVTNFDKSSRLFRQHFKKLEKEDKKAYSIDKRNYPLDLDDCFGGSVNNEFPVQACERHKSELLEKGGQPGLIVDISLGPKRKLEYKSSTKMLADDRFDGGILDAPVIIYEMPQSNDFEDYIYCCGLDPYKKIGSGATTNSLGAFYVFKRYVNMDDPFANRIVASYVSRPSNMDYFCRVCEILQDAYGAMCLYENADQMYEIYLRHRQKEAALLTMGRDILGKFGKKQSPAANPYGLYPTTANKTLIINNAIKYANEKIIVGYEEDTGIPIEKVAAEFIDDIELLNEMIAWDGKRNSDRIVAYGHAVTLAKYYDVCNFMPKTKREKAQEIEMVERRSIQLRGITKRHMPFKQ